MRQLATFACATSAAVLFATAASAQQPASPPPPPTYGPSITLEKAMKVAATAEAEMKKNNWYMAIAIVDPNGDLVYFRKADNTQVASTKIAIGKAVTSARFKRPTKAFFDAMESGHPYVATLDTTLVAASGGVLIMEGGKIIGAAGCSGGTGAQDAQMCQAGADVIK